MRLFTLFIFLVFLKLNTVYNRVILSDVKLEISHDYNNKCLNNISIQNLSNDTITYNIVIWRGDIWYFKHKLKMSPNQIKYYDDAFIVCDNKKDISVELIKVN